MKNNTNSMYNMNVLQDTTKNKWNESVTRNNSQKNFQNINRRFPPIYDRNLLKMPDIGFLTKIMDLRNLGVGGLLLY